jgi:hypothetical protein
MQRLKTFASITAFTGKTGRWTLIALAVAVLLVVVVRVRTLPIPLERDEGEYAYAGQLLLEGIPPYKLEYNMKLPGAYAGYAAIMAVFGQTASGIHLGFLLVNLATLALLFFIARRLFDTAHAALACVCYALLAMSPAVLGLEGHATHLVVLPALAGLLLLLHARESGKLWVFGLSGLGFGASFVCKQPGLVFGMCAATVLLRDLVKTPASERMLWARKMVWFVAGWALPFLVTCLLMSWAGTFDHFWFWTIDYAQVHAGLLNWHIGLLDLEGFYQSAGAMRWSWLIALAGLVCLLLDKNRSEAKFIIVSWLAFSLAAFTASFYFTRHYFIMVLPVVSILVAIAARRAAARLGEAIPACCFGLACAAFVFVNRALWFQQTPQTASHAMYGGNPFPEAVAIADYIEKHSTPKDTIAIMGSEPEIYFLAHRHSASGYIYMYDLMQTHEFALGMQKDMIREVEASKPLFMITVYVDSSWLFSKSSDLTMMDWIKNYASKYYDLIGITWIMPDRSEYVWGPEVKTKRFDTDLRVVIMQRKPGV